MRKTADIRDHLPEVKMFHRSLISYKASLTDTVVTTTTNTPGDLSAPYIS